MTGPVPLARPLPRAVVGDRVRLELWGAHLTEVVRALVERSQPELSAFLPWAMEPLSAEAEDKARAESEEQWRNGLTAGWALLEGSQCRGMVGLHRRGGPHELEIGYWLETASTGRGLMTDACTLATDVAFATDGVEVVEIIHDVANARSGAVPARLGYRRIAAFTARPVARCETGIKVRWCVRRDDWRAAHPESSVRSVED